MGAPMTTASSISQSSWTCLRGMTTVLPGPTMVVVGGLVKNTMGSKRCGDCPISTRCSA